MSLSLSLSLSTHVKVLTLVLRINSIYSIIEPAFAKSASQTVTTELRAQVNAAVAAFPPTYCQIQLELSDS